MTEQMQTAKYRLEFHPTTRGIPMAIWHEGETRRLICYFKLRDGSLGDATMDEARKMCAALNA